MENEIKKKITNGLKLNNKHLFLIFLLSPLLTVLILVAIPFGALIFLFKSYWDFRKEFRIIKQKHLRTINQLKL
ncbi:hypothetical protein ACFSKN_02095 [Mariniflexile gromovii]|uniref:Sugar transferase n=1 Tax=Mariniflexile gromovii TaxID=362523 RepID=A0ABS4BP69_9FLAO|nr:hypothetical protein [Mariniflexile gromovii]MBP0902393.1 hypothetical protein [Mariniflexile gromovii]